MRPETRSLLSMQDRPVECVQEAGDLVFVPDMWGHGVYNEADSVGFAAEFSWAHTAAEFGEEG